MSAPLTPRQVDQLLPVLGHLAETVRRFGDVQRDDIDLLLLGQGIADTWAQEELSRWTAILRAVRGSQDAMRQEVARRALILRGVPEAPAELAVAAAVGAGPIPVQPMLVQASVDQLSFGVLALGQTATRSFEVRGGPGSIESEGDLLEVSPRTFGPGSTDVTVTVRSPRPAILFASLRLVGQSDAVEVLVSAQWEEIAESLSSVADQAAQTTEPIEVALPVQVPDDATRTPVSAAPPMGAAPSPVAASASPTLSGSALTLRGQFILPDLLEQGLHFTLSLGGINRVFPLNRERLITVAGGGARLIDVTTGDVLWEILCPNRSAALSPDQTILALAVTKTVYLWDLRTGDLARRLEDDRLSASSIAFSPAGESLAISGSEGICMWHLGRNDLTCFSTEDMPWCVAYSPDGSLLASGHKSYIRLWDSTTGRSVRQIEGHEDFIQEVRFSPAGLYLASHSSDSTVRLWSLLTGEEVRRMGSAPYASDIAFSPDGSLFAWRPAQEGGYRTTVVGTWEESEVTHEETYPSCVSFTSDSQYVLAAGGSDILLQQVGIPTSLERLEVETISGRALALAPDGRTLAVYDWHTVQIWDLDAAHILRRLETKLSSDEDSVTSLAFTADGRHLLVATTEGRVYVWEVWSGQLAMELGEQTSHVVSLAVSPNGRLVATGSGAAWGWGSRETGDCSVRLWDLTTGKGICRLGEFSSTIFSLAFSPDGQTLAVGSHEAPVRLWDVDQKVEIAALDAPNIYEFRPHSLAFSPDGNALTLAMYIWEREESTGRWKEREGEDYGSHSMLRPMSHTFTPDGAFLVSSDDEALLLRTVSRLREVVRIVAHTGDISGAQTGADGRYTVTESYGTVQVWKLGSSPAAPFCQPVVTDTTCLDLGVLRPGTAAHAMIEVSGGPGRVEVQGEGVTVEPQEFGIAPTSVQVEVGERWNGLLWGALDLVTAREKKNIRVVGLWSDDPALVGQPALSGAALVAPDGNGTHRALSDAVASANPNSVIYLSAGTHFLADKLHLNKPLTILGAGLHQTRVIGTAPEYVIMTDADGPSTFRELTIEYDGEPSERADCLLIRGGQVTVESCVITGGSGNPGDIPGAGIRVAATARAHIRWCDLHGSGHGAIASDSARMEISESWCSGNSASGLTYSGDAGGVARQNTCTDNEGSGISLSGWTTVHIEANTCSENVLAGIAVDDGAQPELVANTCSQNRRAGISYSGSSAGTAAKNVCSGNKQHGFTVVGRAHPTLEENECFSNRGAGAVFRDQAGGIARRNRVHDHHGEAQFWIRDAAPTLDANACSRGGTGIFVGGKSRAVVQNNTCSEVATGIYVADEASPKVAGNSCTSTSDAGITASGQARPVITGNTCFEGNQAGIRVERKACPSILNNKCSDQGGNGIDILLHEQVNLQITGNTIENNGRYAIRKLARDNHDRYSSSAPWQLNMLQNTCKGNRSGCSPDFWNDLSIAGSASTVVSDWVWRILLTPRAIRELAFNPASTFLAVGDEAGTVWVMDLREGKELYQLPGSGPVTGLAFTDNEPYLICGRGDDGLTVYHMGQGDVTSASQASVRGMALSPSGALLATASRQGSVTLWSVQKDGKTERLETEKRILPNPVLAPALAFSPDGKILARAMGEVEIWDLERGQTSGRLSQSWSLPGTASPMNSASGIGIAADGPSAFVLTANVGDPKHHVAVWRVERRRFRGPNIKEVCQLPLSDRRLGPRNAAFAASAAGSLVAAALPDDGVVVLHPWTRTKVGKATDHHGAVSAIAFDPTSRCLVTGDEDGMLYFWRVRHS